MATSASAMHRSVELGVVPVGSSSMPVNTATTPQHMVWNSITTVLHCVLHKILQRNHWILLCQHPLGGIIGDLITTHTDMRTCYTII